MTGLLVIATLLLLALVVGLVLFLRMMARRVVAVSRPRKTLEATGDEDAVVLPRSELTEAPGIYGLWFGEDFREHAVIGDPIAIGSSSVSRSVLSASTVLPAEAFSAQWTGHAAAGPDDLNRPWRDVSVPLQGGGTAPAWFFPADSPSAPWAIHVQGIRTSRLVTLRAVEAAQRAGLASLVITYRGAGDGARESASTLGLSEWVDLRDAVAYARAEGAPSVVVVAYSMGAGLALELARQEPLSVDRLVLICPATNWRKIVEHAAAKAHVPRFVATLTLGLMSTPLVSRIVGLRQPIDFNALDWTRPGAVTVPTVVVHSDGDAEIPFALSQEFAQAHPGVVSLIQTKTAPHGWEANVDPAGFDEALRSSLIRLKN